MTRKRDDVRIALDASLSGVSRDPFLAERIITIAKGDETPVKRKLTLSMALSLILALITCTAAIAAAYRGVAYFLFERYGEPVSLDEDYLISGIQQSHSSPLVTATVTDAYWDGVKLSVAYRVSPLASGQIIRPDCDLPAHDHFVPVESADLQLSNSSLETITITDEESGEIIRPKQCSSNWFCEEDGSISVFHSFPLNSMSKSASVSIPLSLLKLDTGELFESTLNFQLPVLDDPIAEHEHVWLPASCSSPKTCTICQRYEGGLGDHNFQPSANFPELSVCSVCKLVLNWHQGIPADIVFQPGDDHEYVLVLQFHLKDRGYLPRIFSNSYDDATMEAVKAFQQEHGLEPDGICDAETLKALFP